MARRVAVGLRSGEGGAACVVVSDDSGVVSVVGRRPVDLVDPAWTEAPFHAATAEPERADEIIDGAIAFVARRATALVSQLVADLGDVAAIGVVLGNAPAPTRALALRSHVASHAAEGALFRSALLEAASDTGVPVFGLVEHDVLATLGPLWGGDADARLTALKATAGAPWRKPEKLAAAVAIVSLRQG